MKNKDKKETETLALETKDKTMILALDPILHSWVKRIADSTDNMTQPKVVKLILAEAAKVHADDYIEQINKMNAKDELKKLNDEFEALEAKRKKLNDLLGH